MHIFILLLIIILYVLYSNIRNPKSIPFSCAQLQKNNKLLLDVRDYIEAYQHPLSYGHVHIPVAYLKRNIKDLKGKELILLASSSREATVAERFLLRKSVKVAGYCIVK